MSVASPSTTVPFELSDDLLQGFLDESLHGLREVPGRLADFCRAPGDAAPLHAVFRAIHSIKGNASFFGLSDVKQVAHVLENTLDEIRSGRLPLTTAVQQALVESIDLLDDMLHLIQCGESTGDLAAQALERLGAIGQLQPSSVDTCEPDGDADSLPAPSARQRTLRINEDQLEEFVADISRLFGTCEQLRELQAQLSDSPPISLADDLKQINAAFLAQSHDLLNRVVNLRKVPAATLLGKFPRMARSLATRLGKELEITLVGDGVGIDKSLVEDLDAPLTHIFRNICDHGIESPAERAAAGKPANGRVLLHCELTRSDVVIIASDDGRGIDPERVRRKAIEKNLLAAEQVAAMSDTEAIEMIFLPGFSTADQITDISGRGVGMDVVRTNLRDLGGNVTVDSEVGAGTTFRLSVPIRQTVQVVDGLLVRDGAGVFVVPREHVRAVAVLSADDSVASAGARTCTVQGETLAAVSPCEMLMLPNMEAEDRPLEAVVLESAGARICLLVDQVLGEQKLVVNGLRDMLPGGELVTGVAQLGDGKLALVLSPPDIVRAGNRALTRPSA